jgi:hypothetical protein
MLFRAAGRHLFGTPIPIRRRRLARCTYVAWLTTMTCNKCKDSIHGRELTSRLLMMECILQAFTYLKNKMLMACRAQAAPT